MAKRVKKAEDRGRCRPAQIDNRRATVHPATDLERKRRHPRCQAKIDARGVWRAGKQRPQLLLSEQQDRSPRRAPDQGRSLQANLGAPCLRHCRHRFRAHAEASISLSHRLPLYLLRWLTVNASPSVRAGLPVGRASLKRSPGHRLRLQLARASPSVRAGLPVGLPGSPLSRQEDERAQQGAREGKERKLPRQGVLVYAVRHSRPVVLRGLCRPPHAGMPRFT